jgi:hypothetical protein
MGLIVDKKPKPIRVRYKGAGPLRHSGVGPKSGIDGYLFSGGNPVEIGGIPLDGRRQPLPIERVGEAVAWDTADIDFFQRKAARNPDDWEIVQEEGIAATSIPRRAKS